jgi:hypothetical protein
MYLKKGGPTEGLLSWIGNLLHSEQRNIHLLVTSRLKHNIKSRVSEFACKDDMIPIQSDLISDDIRAYVRTRVRQDKELKRWHSQPVVQNEIETRLMEKANGM